MSLTIRWLGHAGFRVAFPDSKDSSVERVVYIDAWLQNPKLPQDFKGKTLEDADLMLITHGHFDHASSAPDIVKGSKKEGAKIVANWEICKHYQDNCSVAESMTEMMNKGGTIDYGYCKVSMTTADHSSSCISNEGHIHSGGDPTGFVITIPHINARIYHAGDTNVFMDM